MLMPDPMAGLPPRLLRTPDAARFLGISNRTLEKHRWHRAGLSQDGRSCRLCRRGSASMVRDRRAQVDHGPDGTARFPGPPIDRGRTRNALNDARCRTGTAARAAPERADPARSLRGDRRRRQPARSARPDGAAILLAVEIAAYQADPLPCQ